MYLGENDGRTTEQRAEEDYRTQLRFSRTFHQGRPLEAEIDANILLGRNVMREETGFFGPWRGAGYNLDKATQDRLLAHIRQDVAATHGMATAALRHAFRACHRLDVVLWLLALLIALNGAGLALLVALWFRA